MKPFAIKKIGGAAGKPFAIKPLAHHGRQAAPKLSPVLEAVRGLEALPATWAAPVAPDASPLDQPHWICLVFQLREQKLELLHHLGLDTDVDKHIDGDDFMRAISRKPAAAARSAGAFSVRKLWTMPAETATETTEEPRELTGFQARAKAEAERFRAATDSEYWCCLCFASAAAMAAAARRLGLEPGARMVDGLDVSQSLGATVTTTSPTWTALKTKATLTRFV